MYVKDRQRERQRERERVFDTIGIKERDRDRDRDLHSIYTSIDRHDHKYFMCGITGEWVTHIHTYICERREKGLRQSKRDRVRE